MKSYVKGWSLIGCLFITTVALVLWTSVGRSKDPTLGDVNTVDPDSNNIPAFDLVSPMEKRAGELMDCWIYESAVKLIRQAESHVTPKSGVGNVEQVFDMHLRAERIQSLFYGFEAAHTARAVDDTRAILSDCYDYVLTRLAWIPSNAKDDVDLMHYYNSFKLKQGNVSLGGSPKRPAGTFALQKGKSN